MLLRRSCHLCGWSAVYLTMFHLNCISCTELFDSFSVAVLENVFFSASVLESVRHCKSFTNSVFVDCAFLYMPYFQICVAQSVFSVFCRNIVRNVIWVGAVTKIELWFSKIGAVTATSKLLLLLNCKCWISSWFSEENSPCRLIVPDSP